MVASSTRHRSCLSLKELLDAFPAPSTRVVTRRTLYDLRKARERAHVLEGLMVALANVDEVIALIRARRRLPMARYCALRTPRGGRAQVTAMLERAGAKATRPEDLTEESGAHRWRVRLSTVQAQAILDLRLHRLTGLEQDKISHEYGELIAGIQGFLEILSNPDRLLEVIRTELTEVRAATQIHRRTEIVENYSDLTIEDLIPVETVVVTLSHSGYAKSHPRARNQRSDRWPLAERRRPREGRRLHRQLFVASSHEHRLCFSSRGKAYWLKVYQIPQAERPRADTIINLLPPKKASASTAILRQSVRGRQIRIPRDKHGTVKKTPLAAFAAPAHGERHHRRGAARRRPDLIGAASRTARRTSCCSPARQGHPFAKATCDRWAATPRAARLKFGRSSDELIALIIVGAGPIMTATATATASSRRSRSTRCRAAAVKASSVFRRRTQRPRRRRVAGLARGRADADHVGRHARAHAVRDISTMGRNTRRPVDSPRRERSPRRRLARRGRAGRENSAEQGTETLHERVLNFQPRSGDAAGTVHVAHKPELLDWNGTASSWSPTA